MTYLKRLTLTFLVGMFACGFAAAQDKKAANSQQTKMAECNKEAGDKKGDDRNILRHIRRGHAGHDEAVLREHHLLRAHVAQVLLQHAQQRKLTNGARHGARVFIALRVDRGITQQALFQPCIKRGLHTSLLDNSGAGAPRRGVGRTGD